MTRRERLNRVDLGEYLNGDDPNLSAVTCYGFQSLKIRSGHGACVVLRPCGVEVSTSNERYHWSNVIKAASYLPEKKPAETPSPERREGTRA
jgi:hypothetical protein